MPGAEGWLLRCLQSLLLPSAPAPQLSPLHPWPGRDLGCRHKHPPSGKVPGAAVQQPSSHAAQAASPTRSRAGRSSVGDAAGAQGNPATGTPLGWDRLL